MEREDNLRAQLEEEDWFSYCFANEMCIQSSTNFNDPKYRQKFAPKEHKFSPLEKTGNNWNEDDRSQWN